MSEENVEIVRALIDAWNRGEWDAALKDADPGFEFDATRTLVPGLRGVYRRDQMRRVWTEITGMWESLRIEPHEFIEAGEHVVVPLTWLGVGRDGMEARARVAFTFTIRDGAIEHACMYQERDEALEAVGLSG